MNTFHRSSRILALVVASLACASLAQGQNWVASKGVDSNTCGSHNNPCLHFQMAHDNTNGPPGWTINVVDPGDYSSFTDTFGSTLSITKAITIDGGGLGIVEVCNGYTGISVNAPASAVVTIRNLSITGLQCSGQLGGGNGIKFNSGKALRVENVTISGFSGGGGIGIFMPTSAFAQLTVENTTITDCDWGIQILTSVIVAAELDHVRIWGGSVGVYAANGARITLRNSEVSLNSSAAVFLNQGGQGSEVDIDNTTLNYNGKGVQAQSGTLARIANNLIMNNGTGLSPESGGQIISAGDNTVVGNFTDGFPTSTLTKR